MPHFKHPHSYDDECKPHGPLHRHGLPEEEAPEKTLNDLE